MPTGAACSWYGVFSAVASTGAGSGSLTPWSADASFAEIVLSGSLADFIRSGFHSPLITGLTKSLASLSHLSLSQFFQPPFFHLSTSTPCSLSRAAMSPGIRALSWPAACEVVVSGLSLALSSLPLQAVAVSARAATVAARTVFLPRRRAKGGRTERMLV